MTSTFLSDAERNWFIDQYVECEMEIDPTQDAKLIALGMIEMTDGELIDEAVSFMPDILDFFKEEFGEVIVVR